MGHIERKQSNRCAKAAIALPHDRQVPSAAILNSNSRMDPKKYPTEFSRAPLRSRMCARSRMNQRETMLVLARWRGTRYEVCCKVSWRNGERQGYGQVRELLTLW